MDIEGRKGDVLLRWSFSSIFAGWMGWDKACLVRIRIHV